MNYLISALIGMFSMRYRGGIFGVHKQNFFHKLFGDGTAYKVVDKIMDGKIINMLIWAAFCTFTFYHYNLDHYLVFVVSAVIMLRYAAPGWGDYIGAAGGWRTDTTDKPLQEVAYIDKMIKRFKTKPVLWGILGLSIRCGEWGFFLGAPFIFLGWVALLPFLVGLLAGPFVFVMARVKQPWTWWMMEALLGLGWFISITFGAR